MNIKNLIIYLIIFLLTIFGYDENIFSNKIYSDIDSNLNYSKYWGTWFTPVSDWYNYNDNIIIKLYCHKKIHYSLIDRKIMDIDYSTSTTNYWRYVFMYKIIGLNPNKIDTKSDVSIDKKILQSLENEKNYYNVKIKKDWEPQYIYSEKKKIIVNKIKSEFIKYIKSSKRKTEWYKNPVVYIREFNEYDKNVHFLLKGKNKTTLGTVNISFDPNYDYSWQNNIVLFGWNLPIDFDLENYKGEDEMYKKFSKYYIKIPLEIK